ncbi:unnamed protein product [Penicillium viridicatum]
MSEKTFDPQRSAELHNQILHHAWTGAGHDVASLPSTTWWEDYSPVDLEPRLTPKLAKFLRSARSTPSRGWASTGCYTCDEEVGIVFDQDTELATYMPHWQFIRDSIGNPGCWMPLQQILGAYLEMINEGKVEIFTEDKYPAAQYFPWEYYQYTQRDIEKSITAFNRLLNAIEHRHRPSAQSAKIAINYPQSVLDEAFIPNKSFVGSFLSALPSREIQFGYIAPGIRIQSFDELKTQPFAALSAMTQNISDGEDEDDGEDEQIPFLLFRADGSNPSPWCRPYDNIDIPAGLYIEEIDKNRAADFGNMSRLLLPFGIGSKGYARDSTRRQIANAHDLYQACGSNGFLEFHGVQLHKVLLNWAERVEMGDWEVDENGVSGGIQKFKDADTPGHWEKYQIPLSW